MLHLPHILQNFLIISALKTKAGIIANSIVLATNLTVISNKFCMYFDQIVL